MEEIFEANPMGQAIAHPETSKTDLFLLGFLLRRTQPLLAGMVLSGSFQKVVLALHSFAHVGRLKDN